MNPELAGLLDAQREATEDLPYDLLGVRKPKLVQVYVRQAVRGQAEDDPSAAERVMSVDEALNGHDHLVITGEPGAGKSTVGHFYVKAICDSWREGLPNPLREKVVPLRVPARSLAVAASWSEALASGAREALGTLLDGTPTPELFAARQEGARWLVFVDGLDEIADTATRTRVSRSIARQVRRGVGPQPAAGHDRRHRLHPCPGPPAAREPGRPLRRVREGPARRRWPQRPGRAAPGAGRPPGAP